MFYVELHVHTTPASDDSSVSVKDMVEAAKKVGLDGIAISNHYSYYQLNRFGGTYKENLNAWFSDVVEAKKIGKEVGLKVFAGMEYTIDRARHFGVIGLTEEIFKLNPPTPEKGLQYLLGWARECKVLLVQNHPFRPGYEFCPVSGIGYELYNTKYADRDVHAEARLTYENARRYSNIFVCGCDAHRVSDLGTSATVFNKAVRDEVDLKERIERKEQLLAVNAGNASALRDTMLMTIDSTQFFV